MGAPRDGPVRLFGFSRSPLVSVTRSRPSRIGNTLWGCEIRRRLAVAGAGHPQLCRKCRGTRLDEQQAAAADVRDHQPSVRQDRCIIRIGQLGCARSGTLEVHTGRRCGRCPMSMMLTTWSSSWLATFRLPSGVKNTSLGRMKLWPGTRSPGRGTPISVRPCGPMITRRLLSSSATMTGAGRTPWFRAGSQEGSRDRDGISERTSHGDADRRRSRRS